MWTGNALRSEAGLLAVTVMGVCLAWQRRIPIQGIVEFKESLRTLLIAILFIVLAARVDLGRLATLAFPSAALLAGLVLIVRPASVAVATIGTALPWRERMLLMAVAPRGIVAAAVASVLSSELEKAGFSQAPALVPVAFFVIAGTIVVYSVAAPVAARVLGLSSRNPQGVLLLGAHEWARAIAQALAGAGIAVRLADSNYANVQAARMSGLPAHYCNFLDERIGERIDLDEIGKCLAVTSNDQANALAAVHFTQFFDRSAIYQLSPRAAPTALGASELPLHLRGRILFSKEATFDDIERRVKAGALVKRTRLSQEFDWQAYQTRYGTGALPLFVLDQDGLLHVFTADARLEPRPGDTVIALVKEPPAAGGGGQSRAG